MTDPARGRTTATDRAGRVGAVIAFTVALIAAGCAAGDGESDDGARERGKRTFASAFSERVGPNGEIDLALALDLFATAFGPLPGTDPNPLPTEGLTSGTLAVRAVRAHDAELTEAQRAAVAEVFEQTEEVGVVPASGSPPAPAGGPGARARGPDRLLGIATDARDRIEAELGRPLGLDIRLETREPLPGELEGEDDPDVELLAFASVGGDPEACQVIVTDAGAALTGPDAVSNIAHEVFHCFQDTVPAGDATAPAWVTEGSAEWVGETLAGGSENSAGWWSSWLASPVSGLFTRSYDGIGFFSVLDAAVTKPWSVFDGMMLLASQEAYDFAAGGAGTELLATIAKTIAREPDIGAEWEATGPGITGDRRYRPIRIDPDTTSEGAEARDTGPCGAGCADRGSIVYESGLQAYSTDAYPLRLEGDVLQVGMDAPQGAIGFDDGSVEPLAPGAVATFCLSGSCVCPDGSFPFGSAEPLPEKPPGPAGLAIATDTAVSARVIFASVALEDACDVANSIDQCLLGTWALDTQPIEDEVGSRVVTEDATVDVVGTGEITFRGNGSYNGTLDLTLTATITQSSVDGAAFPVTATVTIAGGGEAGYSADGFTIYPVEPVYDFAVDAQITVDGRPVGGAGASIPGAGDLGEGLFAAPMSYSCTEERLAIVPPAENPIPVEFNRVE